MSSSGKRVRTTVARQRSTLLRGLSASLAVTVAAGAALLVGTVGTATVASAAAPPSSLTCDTGFTNNNPTYASTWPDTNAFTLTPANVSPGDTVTATWTSALGLPNGSPAAIVQGSVQVQALVSLSGAMTGKVVATTTPNTYPASTVVGAGNGPGGTNVPLGPVTASTTFTAAGSGTLTATVLLLDYNSGTVDTYCSPAATNFPAAADPLATYLGGYTPNWQSPHPASPGTAGTFAANNANFNDLQVSSLTSTVATASVTVAVASPSDSTSTSASPSDSTSTSASPSDSTSTSASPSDSTSTSASPSDSTSTSSSPSASASTPPGSLFCNTSNNSPNFKTTYSDTMTFTLSPAAVTAGDAVTATYTGTTGLGNGSPVTLDKGTVQVQAVAALSGAMTGNVVAVTAPNSYPTADKASGDPLGAYSASTMFTAAGSGSLTATVSELIYKAGTGSLDTYCSPTDTAPGNYPAVADPTITSTLLSCYLPDWQSGGYDNGQVSGTATSFASSTITVNGSTATPTTTDCPTPTPTNSTSSSPTTSTTTAPPISANVPSTVTKQVTGVYCQIFTASNGLLWNGPAAPGTAGSDSVAAPKFTVSLSPQVPKPGQKVTVTVSYNVGNGAGPYDIPANGIKLRAVIQLSGSLTNQVIATSAALPPFAGSGTNPNSRVPSKPIVGYFTMPTAANSVVYASLLTITDDDGNPANIGNTNADPTKGDTFNWPTVTDLYDVVCNKSLTAKKDPLTPTSGLTAALAPAVAPLAVSPGTIPGAAIGVTAGVPYTGTVTTPPTTTESASTAAVVSGDTLPKTGASGVLAAGIVAAIVIQLGMILYVRSVRAAPVRRPSHA